MSANKRVDSKGGTFASNSGTIDSTQFAAARDVRSTSNTRHDNSQTNSQGHAIHVNVSVGDGNGSSGDTNHVRTQSSLTARPSRPTVAIPTRGDIEIEKDAKIEALEAIIEALELKLSEQLEDKNRQITTLNDKLRLVTGYAHQDVEAERERLEKYIRVEHDIHNQLKADVPELERKNNALTIEITKLRAEKVRFENEARLQRRRAERAENEVRMLREQAVPQVELRNKLFDERSEIQEAMREHEEAQEKCLVEIEEIEGDIQDGKEQLQDCPEGSRKYRNLQRTIAAHENDLKDQQASLDKATAGITLIKQRLEEIKVELGEADDVLCAPATGHPTTRTPSSSFSSSRRGSSPPELVFAESESGAGSVSEPLDDFSPLGHSLPRSGGYMRKFSSTASATSRADLDDQHELVRNGWG